MNVGCSYGHPTPTHTAEGKKDDTTNGSSPGLVTLKGWRVVGINFVFPQPRGERCPTLFTIPSTIWIYVRSGSRTALPQATCLLQVGLQPVKSWPGQAENGGRQLITAEQKQHGGTFFFLVSYVSAKLRLEGVVPATPPKSLPPQRKKYFYVSPPPARG